MYRAGFPLRTVLRTLSDATLNGGCIPRDRVIGARMLAFNPFDQSNDEDHVKEQYKELNREQKRRKAEESKHSTLNPFRCDEDEIADSILVHDVRIVGWSPEEIYGVVMGVQDYYQFIPYCRKSTVIEQSSTQRHDFMEAELQVGFDWVQLAYTSKVDGSTTLDGKKIVTAVCENKKLFDHLNMEWVIEPGPVPHTSSMHFDVSFRFNNKIYNRIATVFKTSVIEQMIPAFEGRLRDVYGEPTILSSLGASKDKVHKRKRRR